MTDLTISQADNNDAAAIVLAEANEKIAIHAFTNGLYDNNVCLIIKARNYSKLKDVIIGTLDEDVSKRYFRSISPK